MQAFEASTPLENISATDPAILQNPYPFYARLRREAPVFRDPKTGIVSVASYELVQQVNRNPELFSSNFAHLLNSGGAGRLDPEEAAIMAEGLPWVDTLLTADPPTHTRYRRIAMRAFPPARVAALESCIAQTTHELLDRFIDAGEVEFKKQFADQLPSIVIADALGVPRSDMDKFHDWLHAGIARLAGNAGREERIASARKEIELQRYFLAAIADRRVNRRNDIVSDLVHAAMEDDGARVLSDAELYGILQQIFNAGQETTAHTLTYAIYQLLQYPDQLQALKADRSLAANAVEETLRHLSPTNNMWRVVRQDTELGGLALKAGEPMLLRYGSGNRDESRFDEADRFDIRRSNAVRHMAFGSGPHTCMGAALARKEMSVSLPIVLERLPNLRFAEGLNSFRYSPSPLLRGVLSLHLRFDRG